MSRISCVRSITRSSRRSPRLRACSGREVLVEDHEVDVALERAHQRDPAGGPGRAGNFGSGCGRCCVTTSTTSTPAERASSRELLDVLLGVRIAPPRRDRDEDRALGRADRARAVLARELLLARADPVAEVEIELRGRHGVAAARCRPRRRPAAAPRRARARAGRPRACRSRPSRRGAAARGRSRRRGRAGRRPGAYAGSAGRAAGRGPRADGPSPASRCCARRPPSRG